MDDLELEGLTPEQIEIIMKLYFDELENHDL